MIHSRGMPYLNLVLSFYRKLVTLYRELSQDKLKTKRDLCLTIEQTSLSDTQKQSILDMNNHATCLGKMDVMTKVYKCSNF